MISNSIGNSVVDLFSILSGSSALNTDPARRPQGGATASAPLPALAEDKVEISPEAIEAAQRLVGSKEVDASKASVGTNATTETETASGQRELNEEERRVVAELARRDAEVRAHERAHLSAGGSAVRGGPSFTFQTGPDGRRYAVGGEVPIQITSSSDDPRERLQHAEQVRRAALAPAEPSPADVAIAARASQEIATAQAELRKQEVEGTAGESDGSVAGADLEGDAAAAGPKPGESEAATGATAVPRGEDTALVAAPGSRDDVREDSSEPPQILAAGPQRLTERSVDGAEEIGGALAPLGRATDVTGVEGLRGPSAPTSREADFSELTETGSQERRFGAPNAFSIAEAIGKRVDVFA